MARESQGLQVLLIGSIMLSVGLGVSLFLYVKETGEATKAVAAEKLARQQVESEKKAADEENKGLKAMIGFPERSTDDIKRQFAEDMKTYGNEKSNAENTGADKPLFDPAILVYSRLLASMNKVIQDRTDELIKARAEAAELQAKFKTREAAKDDQIEVLVAGYGKLNALIKKISGDYKSGQQATAADIEQFLKQVADIKRDAADAIRRAAEAEKNANQLLQEKEKEIRRLTEIIQNLERPDMDRPSGEITGVCLPNKMVWINRGLADALPQQMKFSVYSADAKAIRKGTVEVTRIDGDHSAQARILDDKIADPIMAGDKVFTPFWSPGQKCHFALTGIMNLDGGGRNQLGVVRGLIGQNGGVLDCWLDEGGHKQGQFTADTRFIVVGEAPDRGSPEFLKNHANFLREAEQYPVRKMTLSEFQQRMGYQTPRAAEHF